MSFPKYERYKESGVAWLGNLPEHWPVLRSRRLFSQRDEKARPDDEQLTASQKQGIVTQEVFMESEGRAVVRVIHGADILKHVEPNDFVISMRSFQGGLEWSALRGSISSAYVMLVPDERVVPGFFRYVFKCAPYIQALQSTSNLVRDGQAMRYENFTQIDLPLPDVDEQTAIARFLEREITKIDVLIDKQRRLITLLKEKRQAVISRTVTKGLNPSAPMKNSAVQWLGEIPTHWEAVRLKRLVAEPLMYGANESAEDDNPNNPRYVRITDIDAEGSLRVETFRSLPYDICSQYLLEEGDLLLARSGGTVGKSFIYRKEWGCCCFAGYLIRARMRSLNEASFLYFFLQSSGYWSFVESEQIQSTIQNLSAERYGNLVVAWPPAEEQAATCSYLLARNKQFDELIETANRAIEILYERRSALISAAVTGKIDVRGVAANTSEVTETLYEPA